MRGVAARLSPEQLGEGGGMLGGRVIVVLVSVYRIRLVGWFRANGMYDDA